ncbi:MAG: hypothetical protein Q7S36_03360 [Candidatus Liptonbacteria bacterium]|nr:hypothetical protein [Candidatus Liptonbacteria bacterium]
MPYKPCRLIVHLPLRDESGALIDAKKARSILLGTVPEGCHSATLTYLGSSSELPTEGLYYLDVADGEENAWLAHLRSKVRYLVAYRIEKKKRTLLHRHPRFR